VAKRDPIEQALEKLSALKSAPAGTDVLNALRGFLGNRSNLVVAKAAKIAGERRLRDLLPDLVTAFHKLMADPARLDKRCAAVTEIVTSLYQMDYSEPDVYLTGMRHVQMEGSFGPPIDSAAQLRGLGAQGIVRTRFPDALAEAVTLLVDPEPPARMGAVRALAANGGEAGALALRLKVLTGDSVPDVLAECFSGLLAAPSESSIDFVAGYGDDDDPAVAEAAILALGASRSAKAIVTLKDKWQRTHRGPLKKVLLLALSTSRSEDALQFLLGLLETAPVSTAAEVLAALASQRPTQSIRDSIHSALTRRDNPSLLAAFHSAFPR
jgi:HEAT repeat protein